MKKIINGKRYDTETATKIGEYWNGCSTSDFNYLEEELYQKKTGEFFLYGSGGARTKYSRAVGNNCWSGSETIIPLTLEAAQEWAEKHMEADDYERVFGECAEDESRKVIAVSLGTGTIEKLRQQAADAGKSMSRLVEELILGM